MRKIFTKDEFESLKHYIISHSTNPDANRCHIYAKDGLRIALCFNEEELSVCLCEVTYPLGFDYLTLFDYICSLSKSSNIIQARVDFYEEFIEPITECCNLNSSEEE